MGKFRDIWDRDKDGRNAEKRSFIRYAIVATAIFLIMVGFINQNNKDSLERYARENFGFAEPGDDVYVVE